MAMAEVVEFPAGGKDGPSDDELAVMFAEVIVARWRYVASWGQWMMWDGEVSWHRDQLRAIDYEARQYLQELAIHHKVKVQTRLLNSRTYRTVIEMTRCDPKISAFPDQWDEDTMAINCDGMLYKLVGGELEERATVAGDYVTKSCAVRPAVADCPLWLEFLSVVTGGDDELMLFLQRMAGYCLTGSTVEQILFFLYGPGGNGKSTFINTIAGVMGDYAINAPMDLLAMSYHEHHPTELARLQGARMITASETAEGRRWDETKLKQLTGGDTISARYMGRDFFEFKMHGKFVISGNHKPELRGLDDALKRRVRIIPFTVRIPEDSRIVGYEDKLKAEWPGILAWMIEGALMWQEEGLKAPAAVMEATAEYFEAEDVIGTWLDECTTVDMSCWHSNAELYASWEGYCKRSGEHAGTRKGFAASLGKRRDLKRHKRGVNGFMGRRLVGPAERELF